MTEQTQEISCSFKNEAALHLAYMPFVKNGGLFIRTNNILPLESNVRLSISLIDESEPYIIDAKVIWITPVGAQDNKPPGIGVQFIGDTSRTLSSKIENYLAGMSKSSNHTDTI